MSPKQLFTNRAVKPKPISRLASEDRHIMVELNPGVLQTHSGYKTKGRWQGKFTIASWVRFPEGLMQSALSVDIP